MRRRAGYLLVLLGVLASLAGCSDGGDISSCKVDLVADLTLIDGARLPAVEATLEGRKVIVLIDTGARVSVVSREAADTFFLPAVWDRYVTLSGINGTVQAPVVQIRRLGLGHGVARDLELPVAGRFGPGPGGEPVLGLFGADFLSNYDVEIDEPGHRFAIYRLRSCGSRLQPFDPPAFDVPFDLDDTKIVLDLRLNGVPIRGALDSGAMRTLITRSDARRAGVDDAAMRTDRVARMLGVDMNSLAARLHHFATLQVGGEQLRNFPFSVGTTPTTLLGGDFLRYNRVWISYPLRRLFIQPAVPARLKPPGASAHS